MNAFYNNQTIAYWLGWNDRADNKPADTSNLYGKEKRDYLKGYGAAEDVIEFGAESWEIN